MTDRERVRRLFEHQEVEGCPYTLHFENPLREKMNQNFCGWEESIHNSILGVGCFDTWNTMRPMDNGQQVDAYGNLWRMSDDIAQLVSPILQKIPLEDYHFPEVSDFCTQDQLEEMRKLIAAHEDCYIVGNIGAGYYELTWRLLGVEDTLVAMVTEPEMLREIFDKLDMLLHSFVDMVCTLPVDAVVVSDDWADQRGIMFGAERWRTLLKPYYKELYAYIHAKGKKTITHCCGSVAELIPDLIEIGLDVLESVQPEAQGMDPYLLKEKFGKEICFWGGLGCQKAVTYFTPDELRQEIRRLKREMTRGGGYVLAPSKTLNNTVPVANMKVILEEFTGKTFD